MVEWLSVAESAEWEYACRAAQNKVLLGDKVNGDYCGIMLIQRTDASCRH